MASDIEVGLVDAFTLSRAVMMLMKEKIDAVTDGCSECAPLDRVRSRIVARIPRLQAVADGILY